VISFRVKLALILLFLTSVILSFTEVTSADLSAEVRAEGNSFKATTLAFLNQDTANFSNKTIMFNIIGLQNGGFEVKSIRIKKDGEQNFKYNFKAVVSSGDSKLCSELNLGLMQRDKIFGVSKLSELSFNSVIPTRGNDEWIMLLSLDSGDPELQNKSCGFDIVVRTYREKLGESGGFFDEEKLSNLVMTGNFGVN